MQIPPISHQWLLPTRIHIHPGQQQCIGSICWVALRVVDHYQGLITGTMSCLECRNNPFLQLQVFGSVLLLSQMRFQTDLLDKQFSIPVSIVILPILQSLWPLFQPSNSQRDCVTLMKTMPRPLFAQLILVLEYPGLLGDIIGLWCHLILRHEDKTVLNIIIAWEMLLIVHTTDCVLNKTRLVCLYCRQEDILTVLNDIWSIMPIKIQSFFVGSISETLQMKPTMSCWQRYSLADFHVNVRK